MHASSHLCPSYITQSEELKYLSITHLFIIGEKVYDIMIILESKLNAIRQNYQQAVNMLLEEQNLIIKNFYTSGIMYHDHIYQQWDQLRKLYADIQKEINNRLWQET